MHMTVTAHCSWCRAGDTAEGRLVCSPQPPATISAKGLTSANESDVPHTNQCTNANEIITACRRKLAYGLARYQERRRGSGGRAHLPKQVQLVHCGQDHWSWQQILYDRNRRPSWSRFLSAFTHSALPGSLLLQFQSMHVFPPPPLAPRATDLLVCQLQGAPSQLVLLCWDPDLNGTWNSHTQNTSH